MLLRQKLPIGLTIFTLLALAPQKSWAPAMMDDYARGAEAAAAPQRAAIDQQRRQAELERARQENYMRQQQIERLEQERKQQQERLEHERRQQQEQQELQNAKRERQQQLTNSIQTALEKIRDLSSKYQQSIDNDSILGVIRSKVVMYETDNIPLSLLLIEKKATTKEKKAILQFLELRQSYASKALDVARTDLPASLAEILISSEDGVREIGVALYKGKITYGDANSQLERNFKTKKMEFNAELAKLTAE